MRKFLRVWAFVGTQFIVSAPAIAQPDTLWTKTYGGTDYDYGYSVQECADGGFIIAGCIYYEGADESDVYLIRTNANGDTLWTKTYGGTSDDWGNSVQECADGGFIIAGTTESFDADSDDVYLIRTNADGDTLWTKTYGGTADDEGYSVQECAGGGFVIAGMTWSFGAGWSDVYLIRTDADGDTIWTKTYGGTNRDMGSSVQECASGGFIIAGNTESFGADTWLIRTDSDGDTLWTKTYGGIDWDYSYSVQECADEGFIIAGGTWSFSADWSDVYLIRTDADGDTLWTKTYGGTYYDCGNSVQECADGGFIIAGGTRSFGAGWSNVYLIRTNADGDTLWAQTYGGTDSDWGYSVQECVGGGFIIAGETESFGAGNSDVYLIRVSETGVEGRNERLEIRDWRLEVYPNPCMGKAAIRYACPFSVSGHEPRTRITIYDVAGKLIHTLVDKEMKPGYYTVNWYPKVTTGIYFAKLSTGNYSLTKKLILLY